MSRNNKNHTGVKAVLIILMILMIAATAFLIKMCFDLATDVPEREPEFSGSVLENYETTAPEETETVPPTTIPVPEHAVATATVGTMGDLLMHTPIFMPQYNPECYNSDGTYNFDSLFEHLKDYTSSLDYAVANLETTLCGTDNGYPYHGYPNFNCPDAVVDGARNAGFDMLLTANNHSYDTSLVGYKRTLEVIRGQGLDTLGTYASADEVKWTIKEINGINIGMLCYTYAFSVTDDGRPSLNGMPHIAEVGLCNYFHSSNLTKFYNEVQGYLQEMEAAGAEATMMFIHWGVEYKTNANNEQMTIAQKLCDMGIDVIVGGHPHVIEPIDLIESTVDPEHKTVVIYSTGNAVSNQRTGGSDLFPAGYVEDGILFSVTFEKYSDGSVYLLDADALPTWVNLFNNDQGKREYNILPLDYDRVEEWKTLFGISDNTFAAAEKSYNRTMGLVGEGLEECKAWLDQEKIDREQYYYDLAFFPEKFATEATEAVTEPAEETTAPAA